MNPCGSRISVSKKKMKKTRRVEESEVDVVMKPCQSSIKKKKMRRVEESEEDIVMKPCQSSIKKKMRRVEESEEDIVMKPCQSSIKKKKKIRRVEESEEDIVMKPCQSSIKKKNNIPDFLFAEEMGKEYLIRCRGESVRIETLRGKYVGIVVSCQSMWCGLNPYSCLTEVYNQIRENNGDVFELIYVAKPKDEDRKLNFPFLTVPFGDLEWRKRLCDNYFSCLDGYEQKHLVLFDPQGRRLKEDGFTECVDILEALVIGFGPAFYPFTAEREMQLINEGEAALRSPNPLEALLLLGGGAADVNFVISNDGHTKVPVSQLRDKVVGFFFHTSRVPLSYKNQLLSIYNQLKKRQYDFEIIFVNVSRCGGYTDEETFIRELEKMPWLALPFNDQRVWPLYNMLTPGEDVGDLAIIGTSQNPFVECRGFPIIQEYGIKAYPFNLDAAVNVEIERLTTNLKLADFFEEMHLDFLLCSNKAEKHGETRTIQVSSFLQDNQDNGVVFYIAGRFNDREDVRPHKSKFYRRLINMYHKLDQPFKVVFLSVDSDYTSFAQHYNTMPSSWLAIPFKKMDCPNFHDKRIFTHDPHLVAFDGPSGCLLKMGLIESFGADGADAFPFITHQNFFHFIKEYLPVANRWYGEPGY